MSAERLRRAVKIGLSVSVMLLMAAHASAQSGPIVGTNVQRYANGILSLMAYTVAPDVTTSSLSVTDAATANPGLMMTQFGGGFVVSDSTRVYLEGNAAYSRYDPTFVATDGQEQREIPTRWNSVSATGGVGYDFLLGQSGWSLRPIFNFTLGYVASDLKLGTLYLGHVTDRNLDFLDKGQLNAYGLGGSLMLTYYDKKPERDLDFEARYTNVKLQSYGSTSDAVAGHATAESVSLWGRMRVPTGLMAMDRPVRYVFELAYSNYLDSGVQALGFNQLISMGLGLELDSSAKDIWVSRWRAVLRHVVGPDVSGWSLGLAISF